MGGRGAASGASVRDGKVYVYGTEYRSVLEIKNIKFVVNNEGEARTPMETQTQGRIYVTINSNNDIKAITFYDKDGKRKRQIDVSGKPHEINGKSELPHTHNGYFHDENGTRALTPSEKRFVDIVKRLWYNRNSDGVV